MKLPTFGWRVQIPGVHPAILQDVGFDALEDPETAQPAVDLIDLVGLPCQIIRRVRPPAYAAAWLWSVTPR